MEAFQILARVVVYQTLKTSFERVPLLSRGSQVSGLKKHYNALQPGTRLLVLQPGTRLLVLQPGTRLPVLQPGTRLLVLELQYNCTALHCTGHLQLAES